MSTITPNEKWPEVTRHEPCAICEKPDWCVVSPDGAIAGCMRGKGKNYFKTAPTALGEMYLHRPDDTPRERPTPRPQPTTPTRDIMADRAVFGIVARASTALPPIAHDELTRRFGPIYGPEVAARFGIGYGAGPTLIATLAAAGRTRDAQDAAVLWSDGTVARAVEGRLIIPHVRDGLVHDLRLAGIKALHEETKEMSLPGGYAERGIADLFFNHDALNDLGPDGVIHMAGGAWKTMALVLAGLTRTVGTRGESELSPGQIAALQAAGVRTIILHIDNEEPKQGESRSAGHRLGLAKAERLAVAFTVLIAEPPREPGTPKVDPDALLRDLGPRAVRDYALSAIPLDAWRIVIGEASPDVPDQTPLIATLRADVARLGDQLRREQEEGARMVAHIAAVTEERDFYRRCLDCPDPVVGRAMPALAEDLHRSYQRGHTLVIEGQEFARLNLERAEQGKAVKRGAIATASTRLGADTPHHEREATYNRDGRDVKTTHHYLACPVEERASVARLGLGLLARAAPKSRHQGRKPAKVMPPAVAAQDAPVRREQHQIEKFFSLRDDTLLATATTIGSADYWTADGEQITQDQARAWQVTHGIRAAVDSQHHTTTPLRRFVGDRPAAARGVETQRIPTNDRTVEPQHQAPLPLDVPGECLAPACGNRATEFGYCAAHAGEYTARYMTPPDRATYAAGAD